MKRYIRYQKIDCPGVCKGYFASCTANDCKPCGIISDTPSTCKHCKWWGFREVEHANDNSQNPAIIILCNNKSARKLGGSDHPGQDFGCIFWEGNERVSSIKKYIRYQELKCVFNAEICTQDDCYEYPCWNQNNIHNTPSTCEHCKWWCDRKEECQRPKQGDHVEIAVCKNDFGCIFWEGK